MAWQFAHIGIPMVFPLKWSPILKGPDMSASVHITPLAYQQDPLVYFSVLRHRPGAVLLDSGSPHAPGGRYDILSCDPLSVLTVDKQGSVLIDGIPQSSRNPFTVQQALLDSHPLDVPESSLPFLGGLIGYWSYDLGRILEPVGEIAPDTLGLPVCRCGLYDWALIQDHHEQRSWLVASQARRKQVEEWLCQPASPTVDFRLISAFESEMDQVGYARRFAAVQHYIRAGDCYQINLAQRFSARYQGDLWQAYQHLRQATPTPFSGFMAWPGAQGEQAILSLSPERFLRCHADGHVETRPIKGTRPRGDTPAADRRLAEELTASPKDRAENVMIVDLLRNDLGRVCRPGSVRVPQLCGLERYANVHHLVSVVTGTWPRDAPPSSCWPPPSPAVPSPAPPRCAPCRSSRSWSRAGAAPTAAASAISTCAAAWIPRSPSAPRWRMPATFTSGAAAAWSPTPRGTPSTRRPWTRSAT